MIDSENAVFNALYTAITTAYPSCSVKSEYVEEIASLPCVMAFQMDNYPIKTDIASIEKKTRVTWQVDVFTKGGTRKGDAKAIMALADSTLEALNFTRIMLQPTPNVSREVYRLTARYEAVVGAQTNGFEFYRI